ncbi:MAG: hypothetical protein ACLFR0_01165 [Alphaproteobacteria bacterium]
MIKILGARRILLLLILLALNGVFGATVYMYLQPQLKKEEINLRTAKSQEQQVRSDISDLQLEFDQLEEQRDAFRALQADGFFSNQSRRQVEDVFLQAKQASGILTATVNVRPGEVIEDEDAAKAGYVLLKSPISIRFEGIDDTDVYIYLDYLEKNFPGYLSVEDIYIRRVANVNDTILRAIAGGSKPAMVDGRLELNWTTMVERGDVLDEADIETGGL